MVEIDSREGAIMVGLEGRLVYGGRVVRDGGKHCLVSPDPARTTALV